MFVITPGDVTDKSGKEVRLTCQATGHPEPVISWTRRDGTTVSFTIY